MTSAKFVKKPKNTQKLKPKSKAKYIVGIDEAGRGPLAGPVSVGAVLMRRELFEKMSRQKKFLGLRDSKKLSAKQREDWYSKILKWKKEGILDFTVSMRSAEVIDRRGISKAIFSCIGSCLNKLENNSKNKISAKDIEVFLDGSLKAPAKFENQKTYIGGDDKFKIISLASITAKVRRDRRITKLAKLFPNYAFEVHKGYGTAAHIKAIKKFGLSEIHRKSFTKNI